MAHGHSHAHDEAPLSAQQVEHRRRALRILVVLLVPLAIWTLAALVWMWPKDVASHIRDDAGTFNVPGTTMQTGEITAVKTTSCDGQTGSYPGDKSVCAVLTVKVIDGPDANSTQEFPITSAVYRSGAEVGQKVTMYRIPAEGAPEPVYQFIDFEREIPLVTFGIVFAVLVVVVARFKGLMSLVGLAFAFFVLTKFMMPALIMGKDPLLVGVVGSAAIMFVVLYAAHGFNLRTTTALVGTLFGLGLTAVLAVIGVNWSHLTGVGSEDDYALAASTPSMGLTAVVVCSVIVASLGALNDVTITQASAVWELARTESDRRKIFASAMRIGRDHIASTVYTIAFAAVGAALPVLLFLSLYQQPWTQILQGEEFAAEIIRTAIGSIGLTLAMPVTTAVGVAVVSLASRGAGANPLDVDAASGVSAPHSEEDELEPAARPEPARRVDDTAFRRPQS